MKLCRGQWWKEQVKGTDVHRLAVSFWSCVSFIGLVYTVCCFCRTLAVLLYLHFAQGVSLVVFAPTLLDIAHQLDVSVAVLSIIFLVRAIGSVIGTIGSGVLMDRFPRLQYLQLSFVLFGSVAGIRESVDSLCRDGMDTPIA